MCYFLKRYWVSVEKAKFAPTQAKLHYANDLPLSNFGNQYSRTVQV
jgi:hypothetical protein